MSAEIRLERKDYYGILERTQKGTRWMEWFLGCLGRAIDGAQTALSAVRDKARGSGNRLPDVSLNERQRAMLKRLVDGIEGKLTNAKWAKLAKCSPDTALRDLQFLVEQGALVRGEAGGRSTSYSLQKPES